MALVDVYGSLNDSRNRAGLANSKTNLRMTEDMVNEADKFESAAKKQESASGWGRLLGGGGMGLLSSLIPGLGIPLAALMTGGGSLMGQKIATADKTPSVGKFNMSEDSDYNSAFNEGQYTSAGMDALTAGLLKYAGGAQDVSSTGYLGKANPYNLFKKKYDALGYYPEWLQKGLR